MTSSAGLKRAINFPLLVLYGVGNMVGVGFYALLGKVAGVAGLQAPIALMASALIAYLSAFAFCELCVCYPVSAGPSRYVEEAFGSKALSRLVGVMVIVTGVVSAATICTAFNRFLQELVRLPSALVICLVVLCLGVIAIWGISESVIFSGLITVLTVLGLLYVTISALPDAQLSTKSFMVPSTPNQWTGVITGAFLGFYAFIGFEDLVCNAEEIQDVEGNISRGIFTCVSITMLLYVVVSLVAVNAVHPAVLAESKAPLAELVAEDYRSSTVIVLVSLVAGINGALTQIIMASRMVYGMACEGNAPTWLAMVNPRTSTPVRATLLMTATVLCLSLCLPMVTLANVTCLVMLIVFSLVNIAAWRLKGSRQSIATGPGYPRWISLAGFILCMGMVLFQLVSWFKY